MPHVLNIDGTSENLFHLQMLVHSSKSFCAKHQISYGDYGNAEFDWYYYFGWLKTSISEKLIESAIKLRMMLDLLHDPDNIQHSGDLKRYETDAISGIQLGTIHKGSFKLTLRETFNKIIHATEIKLDWEEEGNFQWWTGNVILFGSKGSEEWELELNIESFAIAANRYIDITSEEVDWYHIYKYDT